jgi:hypothetical protein
MKLKTVLFSFIILVFLLSGKVFSQVGGLSASKLAALCVDVVDHHKVEFEPGFYHVVSKNAWDSDGHLEDLFNSTDSVRHSTGMYFRFTYGLLDKMEIGGSISTDLQKGTLGMRYIVYSKKKLGFALIAGANIPFDNKDIDKSIRLADNLTSVGGGAVMTTQFSENFSLDINAQYQAFIGKTEENHKGSYYVNADLGYYLFKHQFQIVGGIGYQQSVFEGFTDKVLTVYPGVTIETGSNYIIVISAPFDVYGEHSIKNSGVAFALTLTFD